MKNVQLNKLKKLALEGTAANLILLLLSSDYESAAEKKKEKKITRWEADRSLWEHGEGENTFNSPAHTL